MVATAPIRLARKQIQVADDIVSESGRQIAMLAELSGAPADTQRQFEELAQDLDGLAAVALSQYPALMQWLWGQLESGFKTAQVESPHGTVGEMLEVFQNSLANLQRLRAEMGLVERHGAHLTKTGAVDEAIAAAKEMAAKTSRLLAWLNEPAPPPDPAMLEASRKAYQAGEYQELGEMIRDLQGDRLQAG